MGVRIHACVLGCALALGCGPQDRGASPRDAPGATRQDASVPLATDVPAVDTGSPRVEPRPEGRFAVARGVFEGSGLRKVALGDCNGDGRLDAATFGQESSLALYVGREGPRFEQTSDALPQRNSGAGAFVDLDGDGFDDLVIAGEAVEVLPGLGGCRFGPPVTLAGRGDSFAEQVLVTDANLDGRADLSITQRGSASAPHRLLLARGDGGFDEFTPRATPLPFDHTEPGYLGFGMFYEDLDGDGAMDLFALIDQHRGWFSWGEAPGEISQSRDDAASDLVATVDPMSVAPLDYDRDGRVEWFVSGVYNRSRLLRVFAPRRLVDGADAAGVAGEGASFAWGSYGFDADLDGWADLLVLREGPDMGPSMPPVPGPVTLFLNRHDGTFAEVGGDVVGVELNAKGLACGPLSSGGPVGCFALDRAGPVMLVDGLRPRGRQALVRLRGTVSAFDATGARVSVDGASPAMVFVAGGQSPNGAEHARVLQVPLGDRASAAVTVRWPSGIEQRGVVLAADQSTLVTEPAAVALSRRAAPADGRATVDVTVDPRLLGGAAVSVELTGAGSWVGDATTDAQGVLHRALRAPSAPGEARVVVRVGAQALRVRPRVVFSRGAR